MTVSVSPAGATVSYQWMQSNVKSRADGYQPIPGATQKTYTLQSSDVGKYVLCEVTGTNDYTGTVRSSATEAVKAKTVAVTTVTISGNAQVGQTLTANTTPSQATVSYQWLRADASDGSYSNIEGATSKTYVLVEADNGKFIKVKVTGTGTYTGTQTSEATSAVAPSA